MDTAEARLFEHKAFISPEVYDAFFAVVERLEATLDKETIALTTQRHSEIAICTQQKTQGFIELNRIMRSLERTIPSQDVLARLARFRSKLEANDRMLRRQLDAVKEVAEIIVRVLRDHESDGTYSRAYARWDAA